MGFNVYLLKSTWKGAAMPPRYRGIHTGSDLSFANIKTGLFLNSDTMGSISVPFSPEET